VKANLGVVKTTLTKSRVATAAAVKVKGGGEQVIGREGETATLLFSLSVKPDVACIWFRPTSTQSFDACFVITEQSIL